MTPAHQEPPEGPTALGTPASRPNADECTIEHPCPQCRWLDALADAWDEETDK